MTSCAVKSPVSERTDEGVDEQLDESFGGEQQTNTNIFLLQKQTVLKTGGLLQERTRGECMKSPVNTELPESVRETSTYCSVIGLVDLQVCGPAGLVCRLGVGGRFSPDLLQSEGRVVEQGRQRREGGRGRAGALL